jgi:hypothetical protein
MKYHPGGPAVMLAESTSFFPRTTLSLLAVKRDGGCGDYARR